MADQPPSYAEILEGIKKELRRVGRRRLELLDELDKYVEDEMKPVIREARSWGMTDVEISDLVDVTRKTLRQWKEKDAEVQQ